MRIRLILFCSKTSTALEKLKAHSVHLQKQQIPTAFIAQGKNTNTIKSICRQALDTAGEMNRWLKPEPENQTVLLILTGES